MCRLPLRRCNAALKLPIVYTVMTLPDLVDDETVLFVRVAWWETALGLIRSLRIPVSYIQNARAAQPWSTNTEQGLCPGIRVGLGLPGVKLLGRKVSLGKAPVFVDCSAGNTPLLVVDILPETSHGYRRLVITTERAEELAKRITASKEPGQAK